MVSLRQKRSKKLLLILPLILLPFRAIGGLTYYSPDIDVSLAVYGYLDKNEPFPVVYPGPYLGAYLSMLSPFLSNYFNTRSIYTVVETGLAVNEVERDYRENDLLFSIPLYYNLSYRVTITKRLSMAPSAGTGMNIMYNSGFERPLHINLVLQTGLEFRYLIWENTCLKLRFDYGVILENRVQKGYIPYIKIKMPFPFIP